MDIYLATGIFRFIKMKIPFRPAIFLLIFLMPFFGKSQVLAPEWKWAKHFGGSQYNNGNGIVVDNQGNSYVTGFFQGNLALGGGNNLVSSGDFDCFIAKFDSSGNNLWARKIGSSATDYGYGIGLDSSNNVYVTGFFSGTVTVGSSSAVSSGYFDAFLAKFKTDGQPGWIRKGGGPGIDRGRSVAVDQNGFIFITGDYDAEGATFENTNLPGHGQSDLFVARYDSTGSLLWAKGIGGSFSDLGKGIGTDKAGNCIVTGSYQGTVSFVDTTIATVGSAQSNIFILKLNPQGERTWIRTFVSNYPEEGTDVATDENGNVWVTGNIAGTIDFGIQNLGITGGDGFYDVFVLKLNKNGKTLWVTSGGNPSWDYSRGIELDKQGNCYIAGNFEQTAGFGSYSVSVTGNTDAFVVKYDPNGMVLWAAKAGGPSTDVAESIAVDHLGNCYTTGYFYQNISFGSIGFNTASDQDFFVSKLEQKMVTAVSPDLEGNGASLWVVPNPNKGSFVLHGIEGPEIFRIFSSLGQLVFEGSLKDSETIEFQSSLGKGLFFARAGNKTARFVID